VIKRRVFCFLLAIFMSTGCTHTRIHKEFEPAIIPMDEGRRVHLAIETGLDDSQRGITVYGEPYSLRAFVPVGPGDSNGKLSLLVLSILVLLILIRSLCLWSQLTERKKLIVSFRH